MNRNDFADYEFLLHNAQAGSSLGLSHFSHLDQPISILNYIRIANDIVLHAASGRLLDWGCGYGQMSYLLRRRGFQVVSFDIGEPDQKVLPDIPLCRDLNIVHSTHPTALPFDDNTFDIVLSCGVLEHIGEQSQPGNEMKSLKEIARILRSGGSFLIYQLPQKHAWQEAVIRFFDLGYAHPRRYTVPEIFRMLAQTGFSIQNMSRANLIPKNLTGMPPGLRRRFGRLGRLLLTVDKLTCRIPGLNHFAGVLEIVARRGQKI